MGDKRYRSVIRAAYEPWAILPEKLAQIAELLELRAQGQVYTAEEISARIGGKPPERPEVSRSGAIAIMPLFGVLSQRMNMVAQASGGTSTEQFGAVFKQFVADSSIAAIVINVDSPGGPVAGAQELSDIIFNARGAKPIIAVANSLMASAAYWVASAADEIVATPSADVGAIGVIAMHQDTSAAQEKLGVKTTIISAGKKKALLNDNEPLSKEAREHIAGRVDSLYDRFVATVARNRGDSEAAVRAGYGEGATLLANEALAAGLVDRVATLDDVVAELLGDLTATTSARANGARATSITETNAMDPKITTALIRAGLCEAGASDAEQNAAIKAVAFTKAVAVPTDPAAIVALILGDKAAGHATPENAAKTVSVDTTREENILAAVKIAGLENGLDLAATLIADKSVTLDTALRRIADAKAAHAEQGVRVHGATITHQESSLDKFYECASDAVMLRHFGGSAPADFKPTEAARKNAYLQGLPRLAEECLVVGGYDRHAVANLAPHDRAMLAMGLKDPHQLGFHAMTSGSPAYNSTGMFANIMLDAQKKTLRRAYGEAETTFQTWMRQAESLTDFKAVNRVVFGELPDPRAIPENGEFEDSTTVDGKESYKLTVWGQVFSVSWQAVVNDDLAAFSTIPRMQGNAMRRKQNKLAYAVLTDNANLSDGGALFNATAITSSGGHANLVTSGAAPSTTTLTAAFQSMSQMKALRDASDTNYLNITPKWIITSPKHDVAVRQLLGSVADPAANQSGVLNYYRSTLNHISEAQLWGNASGDPWFLAADYNTVDTIEYAYMQGLETPAMDQEKQFNRLALTYRIYQAFAVKAIDFRGLFQNDGA